MSITASGPPPAATVPATAASRSCRPLCKRNASLPRWRCQRLPCRGIEKNRVRRKNGEAVGTLTRHRHQRRRDRSHRQRVDPDDPHRLALAAARLRQGADFQHRAGNGHLRVAGHPGVKALVERALDGAQFQVGLSRSRADRAGELAQRGGIDQVDRKRQRHAQRHGKHGGCVAPGMVAQFLPGEGAKQREHGVLCPPHRCDASCAGAPNGCHAGDQHPWRVNWPG